MSALLSKGRGDWCSPLLFFAERFSGVHEYLEGHVAAPEDALLAWVHAWDGTDQSLLDTVGHLDFLAIRARVGSVAWDFRKIPFEQFVEDTAALASLDVWLSDQAWPSAEEVAAWLVAVYGMFESARPTAHRSASRIA